MNLQRKFSYGLLFMTSLLLVRSTPALRTTLVSFRSVPTTLFRRSAASGLMGNQVVTKGNDPVYKAGEVPKPKVTFTEKELREKLTEEEYAVTQTKGMYLQ